MVIQTAVDGGVLEAPNDEEFINKLKSVRDLGEAEDMEDGEDVDATGEEDEEPKEDPKKKLLAEIMPNGKMEMPSEMFFGCDMSWPDIVHRDIKSHTDALAVARSNGWIADPTASAALGYDYAEEVRKQKQVEDEAELDGNPLLGKQAGFGDEAEMDAEMNDLMKTMTPEEKEKFMADKAKEKAGVGGKADGAA
jgi:hypothetical protein